MILFKTCRSLIPICYAQHVKSYALQSQGIAIYAIDVLKDSIIIANGSTIALDSVRRLLYYKQMEVFYLLILIFV